MRSPSGSTAAADRPAADRLPDWGAADLGPPRLTWMTVVVTLLVGPLAVGLVGVLLLAGYGWPVMGVSLIARAWWVDRAPSRILRAVGARRVQPGEHPRLANIARGLATDLGIDAPELHVIALGGPNALVTMTRRAHLAVTEALLDRYTRTELEAVVAHCLVRLAWREALFATAAVSGGPLGRPFAPTVGADDDLRAVALTRYPPAFAAALEQAEPRRDRFGPLWLVADDSHRPVADRVADLRDL